MVHCNPIGAGDDPIGMDAVRRIFPRAEMGEDEMVVEF
jgi:hypothetical protein